MSEPNKEVSSGAPADNSTVPNPSGNKKPEHVSFLTPKLIGATVGVAVLVIILIVYAVTRPTVIKLNDYAKISYSGYNGYARATVDIDDEKFYKDVYAAAKKNGKTKSKSDSFDLEDLYNDLSDLDNIYGDDSAIDYELSKSDKLSNGDKITLKWKASKDEFKDLKIKLDTSGQTIKVSGLNDAQTIDPFDEKYFNVDTNTKGVHLIVTGSSPMLQVKLDSSLDEAPYNKIQYSIETDNTETGVALFADGDKVKVKAEFDGDNGAVDAADGIVLSQTETEVEIHGSNTFVTDMAQIKDSASLEQLRADIKDYIESDHGTVGQKYRTGIWSGGDITTWDNSGNFKMYSDAVIDSFEFVTEYLSTVKEGYFSKAEGVTAEKYRSGNYDYSGNYYGSDAAYNFFDVVYKIHFTDGKGNEHDAYFDFYIPNLTVDSNGKLVYTAKDFEEYDTLYDSSDTVKANTIDKYKSYYDTAEVNQNWTW